MKKFYIIAALLMATTSAHAGSSISFQINGERIHVEAPRNCNALSCIKITAPGYSGTVGNIDLKGFGSKIKDDDFADTTPANPATVPAPAPDHAPAPQPSPPLATYVSPAPAHRAAVPNHVAQPARAMGAARDEQRRESKERESQVAQGKLHARRCSAMRASCNAKRRGAVHPRLLRRYGSVPRP